MKTEVTIEFKWWRFRIKVKFKKMNLGGGRNPPLPAFDFYKVNLKS